MDMPPSESHPNAFQPFRERTDLSERIKAKTADGSARRYFNGG